MRATVVGGGVCGLTCSVALLEAGWQVHRIAREPYAATVSIVAGAVWSTTDAEPVAEARRWALESRRRFEAIATDPDSGVVALRQWELERDELAPTWWETTPFARRLAPDELPDGFAAGLEIDGFMAEPPVYLRWLTDRVHALGGTSEIGEVRRLEDVPGDLVVNCTGLGAATLVGDTTMFPIRGQLAVVVNPGIHDAVADESDPDRIAYVYPRSREVLLGGSRDAGRTDAEPDPTLTERIVADTSRLDPRVAGLDVGEVRVGFRPGRPTVRVEREQLPDGRPVVHDYGHGGAGYILSWGRAADVVALAGPPD